MGSRLNAPLHRVPVLALRELGRADWHDRSDPPLKAGGKHPHPHPHPHPHARTHARTRARCLLYTSPSPRD
eukprot:13190720-Alexandrium_andersonii.AAC.1